MDVLGNSKVVEGTILNFHHVARVLMDPGSTHSFVTLNFMCDMDVEIERLPYKLEVSIPTGECLIFMTSIYI